MNAKKTTKPEPTAPEAYAARANDIARLIDVLQMELEKHADAAKGDPKCWGRVDEGVREDPVEPSLEVGAVLVLVEGRERAHEGLLQEVLGVGGVAGHPQRGGVELVEVGQGVALEPGAALLVGLGEGLRVGGVARVGVHHRRA